MRAGMKLLLLVLFLLVHSTAYADTYDEIRDEASGNSSEVFNLYMESAVSIDADTPSEQLVADSGYSDLMAAFETASARDPLAALAERYPSVNLPLVREISD